jgi:hypothetical protein
LEQIILYLAILAAISGFGMGLMNLAGPWLKRSNITLPSMSIASDIRLRIASLRHRERGADGDEDEYDFDDEDDIEAARGFAENSFAPDSSLLAPRRSIAIDDEELDEELVGVLEEVAEEEIDSDEDEEPDEDDSEATVFTVAVTASDEGEDGSEAEDADEDELLGAVDVVEDEEDELLGALNVSDADDEDAELDEEEDEDDGEEEDEETEEPEVQVVSAGGGITLLNDGSTRIGSIEDMDIIVSYFTDPSGQANIWLPFDATGLTANTWSLVTILNDDLEPGILNPGESAELQLNLNPGVAVGPSNSIVISTELGATTATAFTRP